MLYLKEINLADADKEYEYLTALPADENGFTNPDHGVSREDFHRVALPRLIGYAAGVGLPEGFVPMSSFLLWEDDRIVGLFRVRQRLNDALREGSGHIGFGVDAAVRGRGYGTRGLALLLPEAFRLVQEDELYLSVNKSNPASLRVQLHNGAYIHHEDDEHYYTRIPRPKRAE